MNYPYGPTVRVQPLLEYLELMEALDSIQTTPEAERRAVIRAIRNWVNGVSAPQPTLAEIEGRA